MKNTINNEIDNSFKNGLLPILEQKAIYNSGEDQISDYDFKGSILIDIDNFISQKIGQIKQIIEHKRFKEDCYYFCCWLPGHSHKFIFS